MAKTELLSFFMKLDGPSGPMWTGMMIMAILLLPAELHQLEEFSNVANFLPIFKQV